MGGRGVKRGVIVARIKPGSEEAVARIFAESDRLRATGARRRRPPEPLRARRHLRPLRRDRRGLRGRGRPDPGAPALQGDLEPARRVHLAVRSGDLALPEGRDGTRVLFLGRRLRAPTGDRNVERPACRIRPAASLEAGEFERARESALLGLAERPDDPVLLPWPAARARSSVSTTPWDTSRRPLQLNRATSQTWRDLGDALSPDWAASTRHAKRFDVQSSLLRMTRKRFSTSGSHRSAPGEPAMPSPTSSRRRSSTRRVSAHIAVSLEIHRRDGKLGKRSRRRMRVEERLPDDPLATLDVAELCLALGRSTSPRPPSSACGRSTTIRSTRCTPIHGLIEVEIQRGHLRRALDLAVDATKIDRLGRTTDVLAFVVAPGLRRARPARPVPRGDRCRSRRVACGAPAPSCGSPCRLTSPHPRARPPRSSGRSARPATRSSTTSGSSATWVSAPSATTTSACPSGERIEQLLDEGSFVELSADIEPLDVLGFVDSKPYVERLAEAQRKTGSREAGRLRHRRRSTATPRRRRRWTSRSSAAAWAAPSARRSRRPPSTRSRRGRRCSSICASGGARMQEGCVSLMQMAKTSQAIARLHEEGVLYVSPPHRPDLRRRDAPPSRCSATS